MTKRSKNNFKIRNFNSRVLILCEGLTEKNYFNALKEDLGLPKTIAVNVFQSNKVDCKGVVEEAIKKARREGFEEIFVVFDHDNQTKRDEAFKLAKDKNIKVVFSSICFELWFLFHYKNSTKAFASEAELEKELKKCTGMESYEKNNFKHYSILKDKMAAGKSNAERARLSVIDNNEGVEVFNLNPFTNVDELVIYLEKQKQ
ncbi:RloB family protein [Flavobacterium piscis]|uniref:RloB domain-containing protein n=1 Tax=Flavobacterium piscis TaxID=1114874 RepID=A0ABU1YDZ2_9FLAO|nr:RloB family protein [Flavobacterium piscis]MDR7212328.1 hypothetical protein [Flavobacterium piscis]